MWDESSSAWVRVLSELWRDLFLTQITGLCRSCQTSSQNGFHCPVETPEPVSSERSLSCDDVDMRYPVSRIRSDDILMPIEPLLVHCGCKKTLSLRVRLSISLQIRTSVATHPSQLKENFLAMTWICDLPTHKRPEKTFCMPMTPELWCIFSGILELVRCSVHIAVTSTCAAML